MFRGINSVNLDAKGRMALPARLREALGERGDASLVVTIDTRERCLLLYPLMEWEVIQARLESLSNMRRSARLVQRLLIGHATDVELDGNGRLLLPAMLREFAGLSKKLVLLGQGNKIEIWAEDLWQKRLKEWLDERAGDVLDDSDDFSDLSV
ncbi:MAG: transcriptional regulator MraZ [Gammaproteobacteria bacterium]|nr:MAG: transcriptional regulator MraZ [Gammaproteobacteria bacterium]TDJ38924.1 MAG: transcriptional regulator MraZ [Gammaproteobacteria bacterium]